MSASSQHLALCEAILSDGTPVRIVARGHSMHPVIQDGDSVQIVPIRTARDEAADEVRVGDILVYRSQLELVVCHRVIGIRNIDGRVYFRTKGDLALRFVENVPAEAILGRVVRIERGNRAWSTETPRARFLSGTLARTSYLFSFVYLILVKTKRLFLSVLGRAGRRNDTR